MVSIMKPILVLYATREGHTRRIARQIAATITDGGMAVDVHDVKSLPRYFGIDHYEAAILAASVHTGEHEAEMVSFVKAHRDELQSLPAAFVSVSLSEAGAERPTASARERAKAERDVRKVVFHFLEQTAWSPSAVKPVAGALPYTHYNPLLRFVMKRIAGRSGGSTDTAHDHDYTDWAALERFVREFVASVPTRAWAKSQTSLRAQVAS
jgi:menaquinone-dependent protoporphyrinogen oxidase